VSHPSTSKAAQIFIARTVMTIRTKPSHSCPAKLLTQYHLEISLIFTAIAFERGVSETQCFPIRRKEEHMSGGAIFTLLGPNKQIQPSKRINHISSTSDLINLRSHQPPISSTSDLINLRSHQPPISSTSISSTSDLINLPISSTSDLSSLLWVLDGKGMRMK
jgi:hypothetical protein